VLPPPPGVEQIARAERGYELLRQGKIEDADRLFRALATASHPEVVLMGREGVAEVMLARGDAKAALAEANDIIAKSPTRSAAYLLRGRALSTSGDGSGAQAALQQAAGSQTSADFSWQKSTALVAVGNAQMRQDPKIAIKTYERASRENPQSVDALSNLAVALNQTGQSAKAKSALERARELDPNDAMTAALLRQVQDGLAEDQDRARQAYIDNAVKDLAAQFRNPAPRPAAMGAPDDWTSPVLALSVLPFQDQTQPGVGGRIGFDGLLQQELIRELQARGYTLVERRLLDKVLAEVKLGSSEIADQDTQIKLGKVLAARLMVSGVLGSQGDTLTASLRAIDTETTQLALVRAEKLSGTPNPTAVAATLAQAIAATVQDKYPLKGRVVAVEGQQAVINLGKKHGLTKGQAFNVLVRGEPIELNGRVLGYKESRIAQLAVTDVQDQLAYARIVESTAALEKNQRIIARRE
jgi:tetratricopeptide (TPR) repeat protein